MYIGYLATQMELGYECKKDLRLIYVYQDQDMGNIRKIFVRTKPEGFGPRLTKVRKKTVKLVSKCGMAVAIIYTVVSGSNCNVSYDSSDDWFPESRTQAVQERVLKDQVGYDEVILVKGGGTHGPSNFPVSPPASGGRPSTPATGKGLIPYVQPYRVAPTPTQTNANRGQPNGPGGPGKPGAGGDYGGYDYETDRCPNPNTGQSKSSKTHRFTPSKKSSDQCKVDGKIEIVDRIEEHPNLVREATKAYKSVGKDITSLIKKLEDGNPNPGIGNEPVKGVKGRISEARSRNGARVFHRKRRDGKIEVLGVASKHNSKKVIDILKDVYNKPKPKSNNNNNL